eukprot:1158875-Pelagomonas_calceolata.AAC.2
MPRKHETENPPTNSLNKPAEGKIGKSSAKRVKEGREMMMSSCCCQVQGQQTQGMSFLTEFLWYLAHSSQGLRPSVHLDVAWMTRVSRNVLNAVAQYTWMSHG